MRVLIIGRAEALYATARLISKTHEICGIITAAASPEYLKNQEDFEKLAAELACPFIFTNTIDSETIAFIESAKPDIAVSSNWVSVIRQNVIDMMPYGILNAHHGDLPRYRGNAATNWILLKHETCLPLNIHVMEPGELDSGDIMVQRTVEIGETTTIKDIVDAIELNVPQMFAEALARLEDSSLVPRKQKTSGAFRCYPRLPSYSKIDWSQSAKDIDALVRASTRPYSGAYSYMKIGNEIKKLFIWRTRIVSKTTEDIGVPGHIIKNDSKTGESHVLTGNGVIAISVAQHEGEDDFEPGKTWKSIRMRFGIDIEEELIALYAEVARMRAQ